MVQLPYISVSPKEMTTSPDMNALTGVWPPEELEHLGHCPICSSTNRKLLHPQLTDRIFYCAPGEWSLQSCQSCNAAYLDPRPNIQSIGKAYKNYFTHEKTDSPKSQSSEGVSYSTTWLAKLRQWGQSGLNGYRNARWNMTLEPTNTWGRWLVPCIWPLRSLVINHMRHLPRRLPKTGGSLLDVGCGNGDFLRLAQAAGWDVQGVDFDPLAVEAARKHKLDVRHGGLEQVQERKGSYDWITCSHVIEHVHDPVQWLSDMHALLRPGGTLWLQTPNIDSWGHHKFGPNWRDLDPPRHLVLFTLSGLCKKLNDAGFIAPKTRGLPAFIISSVIATSEALQNGRNATLLFRLAYLLRPRFLLPAVWQSFSKEHGEFITITVMRSP